MNDENYWKQFMASGRVEDYLAYAGRTSSKKEGYKNTFREQEEKVRGEYPYAGFMHGDGNGTEPDSCR